MHKAITVMAAETASTHPAMAVGEAWVII